MVWTLPNGKPDTQVGTVCGTLSSVCQCHLLVLQVTVVDLFTADGRDNVDENTTDIGTSTEPRWKPRQWLWQIKPVA